MKRLLWILAAAWCTAFAQVQPVAVVPMETPSCCCGDACECDQGCGMIATLPANPAPAERTGGTEVRQSVPVARCLGRLSAATISLPAIAPVRPASKVESPPDAVPRFCRHCAFLI